MKKMRDGFKLLFAISIFLVVVSCASTQPISLNLKFEKTSSKEDRSESKLAQSCVIHIEAIVDDRSNKDTLGVLGNAPITGDHIVDWVSQGLRDLEEYGFQISDKLPSNEKTGRELSSNISITRVLLHENSVRIYGTVILRTNLWSSNHKFEERLYRGDDDRLLWYGSKEELLTVLNGSLKKAIKDIAKDFAQSCETL
ncbi:MAG: hypothetical protein HY036_00465 [Nitrospirae bacterium]|nr:hypothetical protein [Nitrospirota bacterium]MBI3351028.1 hypothetical protein [Nitrospirota bacterium]